MVGKTTPIPADLAESVKTMSQAELCRHYRIGQATAKKWFAETGLLPVTFNPEYRPVPADFAEHTSIGVEKLRKMYSCGTRTIERWRAEIGFVPAYRLKPDNFAQIAVGMTIGQAVERFGAHRQTVAYWFQKAGIKPAKVERKPAIRPTRSVATISNMGRAQPAAKLHDRAYGPQDAAADVLRSERWPVYRCKETGRADAAGKWWRVGNVVCDGDELLARAAKYARAAA